MLRFRDLTPLQKAVICNGCGGKGSIVPVPEFLFHASCNHHDFYYWRGGSEADRKRADEAFYKFMKQDAAMAGTMLKRLHYRLWAYIYYQAVRQFGAKYFHYGKQRDKEDLKLWLRDTQRS